VSDPNDGGRERSLSEHSSANSTDNLKLTLLAEDLCVEKEAVETGHVRVSKRTHTREVAIDEDLLKESAEIETIPIGRQIFEMPMVRHEGETTIIPIVEEVLHTERRLFLKEEVRITRKKKQTNFMIVSRFVIKKQSLRACRVRVRRSTMSRPTKANSPTLGSSRWLTKLWLRYTTRHPMLRPL
jgi:uncharacterized protein (TIGR02271 family)